MIMITAAERAKLKAGIWKNILAIIATITTNIPVIKNPRM